MYSWEYTLRPDGWNIQKSKSNLFYNTNINHEVCLAQIKKFTKYGKFINPIEAWILIFRSKMNMDKYYDAKVAILNALKLPVVTHEVFIRVS